MAAPWKPKPTTGDYDQPPAGNHPAVMVAMVDLGTQVSEYQGKVNRQRRAMCVWELVGEKDTNFPMDDRNFLVGIDLNVSNNEASKFRQWAAARLNKKFPKEYEHDFAQELGKPCLLSVAHNAKGYPKVEGMSAVPKGMTVPAAKAKPFMWTLDDLPGDDAEPTLPDWLPRLYGKKLTDVIAECVELNPEKHGEGKTAPVGGGSQGFETDEPTGDIPF